MNFSEKIKQLSVLKEKIDIKKDQFSYLIGGGLTFIFSLILCIVAINLIPRSHADAGFIFGISFLFFIFSIPCFNNFFNAFKFSKNELNFHIQSIDQELIEQQKLEIIPTIKDIYKQSASLSFLKKDHIKLREELNQIIISIIELKFVNISLMTNSQKIYVLINHFNNISEFDCLILKIKNIDESKIKSLPNQTNINISTKENSASNKINVLLEKIM